MRIEPEVLQVHSYLNGELVLSSIDGIFCVMDNPFRTDGDVWMDYFTTYASARECFEELKNEIS